MKIEIIYNPYLIQTDVMIDGKPVDDAYSALFPVRNYPLQSWLDKNGSWAGCGATFAAIARGEKLSILFHGRQEDFDDFQERIYAYPWEKEQIEAIQYEPAFQYKTIRGALDNIFELLKTLDSYHGDGSHRDESLIKRVNLARRKWDEARDIVEINNPLETDQKELLKNDNNLCVMECEKTALETRYKTLDYFCRGMRRCPESLVFSESDEGGVHSRRYFNLTSDYQKKYLSESDFSLLRRKYGAPYQIRLRLEAIRDIMDSFRAVISMREQFQKELREMKAEIMDGVELSDGEYERTAACIQWIRKNEPVIEQVDALLNNLWI